MRITSRHQNISHFYWKAGSSAASGVAQCGTSTGDRAAGRAGWPPQLCRAGLAVFIQVSPPARALLLQCSAAGISGGSCSCRGPAARLRCGDKAGRTAAAAASQSSHLAGRKAKERWRRTVFIVTRVRRLAGPALTSPTGPELSNNFFGSFLWTAKQRDEIRLSKI